MLETKDAKGVTSVRNHMLKASEFEVPVKPAE